MHSPTKSLFPAIGSIFTINGRYWLKNAHVESRKELNVSLAAAFAKPGTASFNLNTSCHIDFMFMDAVEVLALSVNNGPLLSQNNGYRECSQLSKVTPFWWTLNGLLAWISGVKDQTSFEGREEHGGISSLVKWNGMSNAAGGNYQEYSSFLQARNLLLNSIPFLRYVLDLYSQMGMKRDAPDQHFHGRLRKKECGSGRARTETKEHFHFSQGYERIVRRILSLPIDNDHGWKPYYTFLLVPNYGQ